MTRTAHLMMVVATGAFVSACRNSDHAAEIPPAARAQLAAPPVAVVADADSDVALPRTVYRQGAEKARKTITLDNAKQKLEDMDAQIEHEKETLR